MKSNDFVEARLCGLDNSSKQHLVKKPSERIEHYFVVQIIAEEIRHYTKKVKEIMAKELAQIKK